MPDTDPTPREVLRALWTSLDEDESMLDRVRITGSEPVLPSVFRVGTVAAAVTAAVGAAAAAIWCDRSGAPQDVSVDVRAAAAAFRSERYLLIDDQPPPSPWGTLSGYFATADNRYVQLHANFPHHHAGIVKLLGCNDSRDAVKAALRSMNGAEFEDEASAAGLCVGLLRSRDEWLHHDQGRAVAELPLLEVIRIGNSPAEPLAPADRPLAGVRVLDLTRIIAGPVCGRTLAAHGADVMRVGAPHLPFIEHLWLDSARGKRSAHVDLRDAAQAETLRNLARQSDVFCQAYRPDALAARDFGPEDLLDLRPGIVYVTLSAYSHRGPWAPRRGFDSLVQTVSGIGRTGAAADGDIGTRPLPCQALDHATGYLAALGAMVALRRRAREGGSYLVRISLAQTGHWLCTLGEIDGLAHPDQTLQEVADLLETQSTVMGTVRAVGPAERLSATPARWVRPATPLGHDPARWD